MSEKTYAEQFRDKKENKSHGSSSFPAAAYSAYFKENPAFEEGAEFYFFNAHWHEEFEVFYLRAGECSFCIDGTCYKLHAGDAIFVPSNSIHWAYRTSCRFDSEYEIFVFHPSLLTGHGIDEVGAKYVSPVINGELLLETIFSNRVPWQAEVIERLCSIFKFYNSEESRDNTGMVRYSDLALQKGMLGSELKIKSLLFDIWYLCMQHAKQGTTSQLKKRNHQEQMNRAVEYIHAHYSEKITLEELATSVYMSKDYFSHVFKEYTRSQPFAYINGYRIRKSLELLNDTDLKMIEIANLCGFEQISYFNRKFAEYMKCTPTEYRRKCQSVFVKEEA